MSVKEAVECLSHSDETYQNCGASYIQHNSYIDDKTKEEVVCPFVLSSGLKAERPKLVSL